MICNFDATFAMDPGFEEIKPQVRDLLLFLSFGIISHGIEGFLL